MCWQCSEFITRQNLFWAFLYNALGISLAVTGILNPIMAAAAMLLSSFSVIGNSSRLWRSPERAVKIEAAKTAAPN